MTPNRSELYSSVQDSIHMNHMLVCSKKVLITAAPLSQGGLSGRGALRRNRVLTFVLNRTSGVGVQTIEF